MDCLPDLFSDPHLEPVHRAVRDHRADLALSLLPHSVSGLHAANDLVYDERSHDLKAFQMQVGLWPVYLSAIVTALTHPLTRPGYPGHSEGRAEHDVSPSGRGHLAAPRDHRCLRGRGCVWHPPPDCPSDLPCGADLLVRVVNRGALAIHVVALFSDRFLDRPPVTPPWQ